MQVTVVTKVHPAEFDPSEFSPTAMIDYPGPASPGAYTITEVGEVVYNAEREFDTLISFDGGIGDDIAWVSTLVEDTRVASINFSREV